jgi:hypothetical protein
MERPDVSHVVARLSNNSVGRREREKFVRPLDFLEERAQAASPSMVPVFIFPSPLVPAWMTTWLGRGFSGDRTRKVAL